MNQPRPPEAQPSTSGHGGHGWMMIACCIPMLILAVALVATGVVSAGFLFFAVGCTVVMVVMMRMMMPNNDRREGAKREPLE
jgi:hypothetical protein